MGKHILITRLSCNALAASLQTLKIGAIQECEFLGKSKEFRGLAKPRFQAIRTPETPPILKDFCRTSHRGVARAGAQQEPRIPLCIGLCCPSSRLVQPSLA